jgi:hypothetical protein
MTPMTRQRQAAALGLSVHTGWASLVAVAGPLDAPAVVDRRRIELLDGPHADARRFVYHRARQLDLPSARRLVDRESAAIRAATLASLRDALAALSAQQLPCASAGIIANSEAPAGLLQRILQSHARIHAGEGQLYRGAIAAACDALKAKTILVPPSALVEAAAEAAGLPAAEVEKHLAAQRARLGPPWGQDQKDAMLAAWCALGAAHPARARRARPRRNTP